ncbi:MAG: hypothetical protein J6K41_03725 [Paraprevotella sp.]|jgi:hypothetical protein B2_12534|nr:hypothetical protein [Paraprevotella sp.]
MTALELNAELFRQLSIIAEDETLMQKAIKAIRRLARQKEAQNEECEYITKEELLAGIDAGLKDVKAGRTQSIDDFIKEMENAI